MIAVTFASCRSTRATQQHNPTQASAQARKKGKVSFLMLNIAYAYVSPVYTRFFFFTYAYDVRLNQTLKQGKTHH